MLSWLSPLRLPLIIAHRGSSSVSPENTLSAFHQAVRDGADAVELDVQLSRDGKVVVFHDRRLERTTDGHGELADQTFEELRSLSAGAWFSHDFVAERIPALHDVIRALPSKIGVNVEIKSDPRRPYLARRLAEECCRIAGGEGHRVLFSSFSYRTLRFLKSRRPLIATGLLYHPVLHLGRSPAALAQSCGANYLFVSGSMVRKRLVEASHRAGLRVGEYTVNSNKRLERAVRYGLDAVFTDNPALVRDWL